MADPTLSHSKRVEATIPSPITEAAAFRTPDMYNMGQGMVFWTPPEDALKAIASGIVENPSVNFYGPVLGNPALRQALAIKIEKENGLKDKAIMITAGANQAYATVITTLCDVGDEVILFAPYYFNHLMALQLNDVRARIVPTRPDWTIDIDALEFTPRTKCVTIVNPSNPTGAVMSAEDVDRLQRKCAAAGVWLISDETYEYFLWDGAKHHSAKGPNVINIFSLSKAFGMAGWRVGYAAVPPHLQYQLDKVQDTQIITVPLPSQLLATTLVQQYTHTAHSRIASLQKNRDTVWNAIKDYEGSVNTRGAFYFFVKLPAALMKKHSDVDVVKYLSQKHRVWLLPGSGFGLPGYLRISYGNQPAERCAEATVQLKRGLEELFSGRAML